ncbi:MAG: hypothetical protein KGR26_12845, partial [Cyanobacteria bacterium REEB65]|nr:hypothetical protein [Cyanobacteria bacterium REEB65]
SPAADAPERIRANGFAALTELDWLSAGGELEVQYQADDPFERLGGALFDACYLLPQSVGPAVSAAIVAEELQRSDLGCRSHELRLRLEALPSHTDEAGCRAWWRAAGTANLGVATDRLTAGIATELQRELLDAWLANGPEPVDLPDFFTEPWQAGSLESGLLGRLATTPDGPLVQKLQEKVDEVLQVSYPDIIPDLVRRGWWPGEAIVDDDPAIPARERIDGITRNFEASLDDALEARSPRGIGALSGARNFMLAVDRVLEHYHDFFASRAQVAFGKAAAASERLSTGLPGKAHKRSFAILGGRRGAAPPSEEVRSELETLVVSRTEAALCEVAPDLLAKLRSALARRLARFEQLADLLGSLRVDSAEPPPAADEGEGSPARLFDPAWVAEGVRHLQGAGGMAAVEQGVLADCGAESLVGLAVRYPIDTALPGRFHNALSARAKAIAAGAPRLDVASAFLARYVGDSERKHALAGLLHDADP